MGMYRTYHVHGFRFHMDQTDPFGQGSTPPDRWTRAVIEELEIKTLEISELKSLSPIAAFTNDAIQFSRDKYELVVSTFLYDLYLKKPHLFWFIIHNSKQVAEFYHNKNWQMLLILLKRADRHY